MVCSLVCIHPVHMVVPFLQCSSTLGHFSNPNILQALLLLCLHNNSSSHRRLVSLDTMVALAQF